MRAGVSARGGRTKHTPPSSSSALPSSSPSPPPPRGSWQQQQQPPHGKLAPVPLYKDLQGQSKGIGTATRIVKQLPRLDILGQNGLLLEAYSGGSWWDAEVIRKVGRVYRIHYVNFTDSYDEQVPADTLRLRSRKATVHDCADGTLSSGVDITVFAAHPHAHEMKGCATSSSAWFDAKVIKVFRRPHQRVCNCKFVVEFYDVKDERGDLTNRRLLTGSKTIGIGKICVLQKQLWGSLDHLLEELLPTLPVPKGAAKPQHKLATFNRLIGKYFSARALYSNSCVELSVSTSSQSRTDCDSHLSAQSWEDDRGPDAAVSRRNLELPRSAHQGCARLNHALQEDFCNEDDLYSSSADSFRCWSSPRTLRYDAHASLASAGHGTDDTMSARNREAATPGPTQGSSYQSQKICFSGPKVQRKLALSRPALVRGSSPRLNRLGDVSSSQTHASPGRKSPVGVYDSVNSWEKVLSSTSSMSESVRKRISPSSSADVAPRDPAAREESRQCSTSADTFRWMKRPSGRKEQAVLINGLPDRKCGVGGILLHGHQQLGDLPEPVGRTPGESQSKLRGKSNRDSLPHMGALEAEKPRGCHHFKGGRHAIRSVDVSGPSSGTVSDNEGVVGVSAKPAYAFGTKACDTATPILDVSEDIRPMWKNNKRTGEGQCFTGSGDQKLKRIKLCPTELDAHSEGKLHKPVEDSGAVEADGRVECSPAVAPMGGFYDREREPFMEDLKKPSCPLSPEAEEDPHAKLWQDYEDILLEEAFSRSVAEKSLAIVGETDTTGKRCPKNEHNFLLDEYVGLVCSKCAMVGMDIADMVPEIDSWSSCRSKMKQEKHEDEDFKVALASLDFNSSKPLETKQGPDKLNCRLDSIPELAKFLHQHQREGFYFLWKNIGGTGGNSSKIKEPGGCILAHAPGTGKSFLVISFLKSYLQVNPHRRTLIIAPKSMLRPWEREFRKWKVDISVFILNTAGKSCGNDEQDVVQLKSGSQIPASKVVQLKRLAMLQQWRGKKSILMTTYSMFAKLIDNSENKLDREENFIRNALLEIPDLLILDEGHLARNETTKVRKALMSIKTKLRILLSGTLFQNNFSELFNTLYLVRPRFAEDIPDCSNHDVSPRRHPAAPQDGTEEETEQPGGRKGRCEGAADVESKARRLFTEKFGRPFEIGEDEGPSGVLIGLKKLTKLTKAFVHYHAGRKVLSSLPELREFAVVLMPNKKQQELLEKVPSNLSALQADVTVTSICIHPVLHSASEPESVSFPKAEPGDGVKTLFVVNLVRLCQLRRERVLIFCQKTKPLRLLQHMLAARFNWLMGREIMQVDGSMNLDERQHNIDELNRASSSVQVMLASTKACGEGVSLIGASRLIFLDIEWNPAVYRQAISRAFRLGQKKQVFVYRLIGSHTLEERRYDRAVWKDWVARRIVDATGSGHHTEGEADHRLPSTSQCEDRLLEKLISSSNKDEPWISRVLKQRSAFAMSRNEELQDVDREHRSDVVYEVQLQQLLLEASEAEPWATDPNLARPIKPGTDHREKWDVSLPH